MYLRAIRLWRHLSITHKYQRILTLGALLENLKIRFDELLHDLP